MDENLKSIRRSGKLDKVLPHPNRRRRRPSKTFWLPLFSLSRKREESKKKLYFPKRRSLFTLSPLSLCSEEARARLRGLQPAGKKWAEKRQGDLRSASFSLQSSRRSSISSLFATLDGSVRKSLRTRSRFPDFLLARGVNAFRLLGPAPLQRELRGAFSPKKARKGQGRRAGRAATREEARRGKKKPTVRRWEKRERRFHLSLNVLQLRPLGGPSALPQDQVDQ